MPLETKEPTAIDLPVGLRPPQDLPDDLRERMRVLLAAVADASLSPTESAARVADLVALCADVKAPDASLRRTTPLLTTALDPEEQRPPTDNELLISDTGSEEHLIRLGRIVDVSASNDAVRAVLGLALGLPDGGFASQRYADATLLGTRVKDMASKLAAVAELDGVAPWLPEAASWAKAPARADERCNQLVPLPATFAL